MLKLATGFIAALMMSATALAQSAHGISAVVNDEAITTRDVQQRVLFMLVASGVEPNEQNLALLQQQAVRALVDEHLQIQEARSFEVEISDEEVNRSLGRLFQRNQTSPEQIQADLARVGVGLETLRDQIRAELAWQTIVNGRFGTRIRISDTQIDETLERIKANANKPSYQLAELFIEVGPDLTMEQAMQAAEAILGQIQQGAQFSVMAQQYSSAPSGSQGGAMGLVLEGELREELDTVVRQMEVGTVSNPIQVPGGVYLMALINKQENTSEIEVSLKQLSVTTSESLDAPSARSLISGASNQITSCDDVETVADDTENLVATDVGTLKVSELNDETANMLAAMQPGDVSTPRETGARVMSLVLCSRDVSGASIPERDAIEDRLIDQQLAMQSKRYLRDIRRSATIESR